jgi:site-specific DNA recombinase
MRFFNYSRKSVFSDRSDSIDNQFRMCRDYCEAKFSGQVNSWTQFSDEAYTGATVDRPDLQRMLAQIRSGLCDALVVYQLDRLSRDVRDFANIYALLEEHHVMFISIKENIDTTTPIGRAMMFVTVTFAQMERETTAARVTDHMLGLAKKGYWVGGNPPIGYVRQEIVADGKKHVTIVPDPKGVAYVTWIFDTFLSSNCSLQAMETRFKHAGIRTHNGKFFSVSQIHKILTMPFCAGATAAVYDYYAAKGCQMDPGSPREQWDGSVGVMVYGRTTEKNKKHQLQPPEKWMVCLGKHQPFISAEKWLAVQNRFTHNNGFKKAKYPSPLLKGVLRCKCGNMMQVSRKKRADGSILSSYYCPKRIREGVDACDMRQTKCEIIDRKVLAIFHEVAADPSLIKKYIHANDAPKISDPKSLRAKIHSCESKIGRLTASLALAADSPAQKYILAEIEHLDAQLSTLKQEYAIADADSRSRAMETASSADTVLKIQHLISGLDGFSENEKNSIVRSFVKDCYWDGKQLFLSL